MSDATRIQLISQFLAKFPQKAVESFEKMSKVARAELLNTVDIRDAEMLIRRASPDVICDILPELLILENLAKVADPADIARLVGRLEGDQRQKIMEEVGEVFKKEIESILNYPPESAGSIMELRVPMFHITDTVKHALGILRSSKTSAITSVYTVDFNGALLGRVYLQELISARDDCLLKELTKATPWVSELDPKSEVAEAVEKNKVPSIPVINGRNMLVGVIRYEQLFSIVHQDAMVDIQKMVGVSKDEKALSPAFFSVKKRLPWLSINLITTFVAAFVVGLFEDTIAKITALAVLLPVVAGQSGNTGAQAQAITMRGLALREIRLRHKWQVLGKETSVGFVNGLIIGVMCLVSVYFWSQSLPLALVIGVAMVLAMVAASFSGAAVPMILTAFGQDPATSSSIILTTITDIVGFLSFLGLATLFGHYLV
jgi:magnesium transporter